MIYRGSQVRSQPKFRIKGFGLYLSFRPTDYFLTYISFYIFFSLYLDTFLYSTHWFLHSEQGRAGGRGYQKYKISYFIGPNLNLNMYLNLNKGGNVSRKDF